MMLPKRITLCLWGLLLAALVSGCGVVANVFGVKLQNDPPGEQLVPEIAEAADPDLPESVEAEPAALREIAGEINTGAYTVGRRDTGMYLAQQSSFPMGEKEAAIEYYIDVDVDEDGNLMWDDTQEHTLQIVLDDRVYPLFAKYHTNGMLSFFRYHDYDTAETRLVVTLRTPHSLTMYEYRYDSGRGLFLEESVYALDGNIDIMG